MRVLMITSAYPPIAGGAESYARTVAEGLRKLAVEVLVVTDGVGRSTGDRTEGTVVLEDYWAMVNDPSKLRWEQMFFAVLADLEKHVAEFRPDVILTNNLETAVLGRMAADQLDLPLVSAFHEHAPLDDAFGIGKVRLAYARVSPDRVLCGSKFYEDRALQYLPETVVRRVYHGVPVDIFAAATPAVIRSSQPEEHIVVCVGRLKERKGQDLLLTAIESLHPDIRQNLRVLLIGSTSSASTEYRDRLRETIRSSGLIDRVEIVEGVAVDQVPGFLAAADIAVVPSREEGLGFTVLEAFASGTPVITSRVPGIDEILIEDGLVWEFRPNDARSLGSVLEQALREPEQGAARARAASALVTRMFDRAKMAEETLSVLQEAVEERSRPGGASDAW